MIFGACISSPVIPLLCDGLQECFNTHFDTEAEYEACQSAANVVMSTCNLGCLDTEEAAIDPISAAQVACIGECDMTFATCENDCSFTLDDCENGCSVTYESCLTDVSNNLASCLAGCDSDPTCEANCRATANNGVAACNAALETCEQPCLDAYDACLPPCALARCSCTAPCIIAYNTAVQVPVDAYFDCQMSCCTNNTDGTQQEADSLTYNSCLNDCSKGLSDDGLNAANTYIMAVEGNCNIGGATGVLGLDDPEALAIYNASGQVGTYAFNECNYACNIANQQELGNCTGYTACLGACQVSWDAGDIDCLNIYLSGGGTPGGTNDALKKCVLANQKANWACLQQCCFYANGGSDPYSLAVKTCQDAYNNCESTAIDSCPDPSGEPVCDPGSPDYDPAACSADEARWMACLTAALALCTLTQTSCLTAAILAATAPLPCSGCDKVFT